MLLTCPRCFTFDDVTYLHAPEGGFLYTCTNTGKHHGDGVWQWVADPNDPTNTKSKSKTATTAVMGAGEGKTNDLLDPFTTILQNLPHGVFYEHGVLEYELRCQYPDLFGHHVAENGHVLLGPGKFTASSTRFAAALMRLERAGVVVHMLGTATGAWSYNSGVSYWALIPAPATTNTLTWVQRCAELDRDRQWTDADQAAVADLAKANSPTGQDS